MIERDYNPGNDSGDWYGTPEEFAQLTQLLAHDQEFATKTSIYVTDLFNGKGREAIDKYNSYLDSIKFDDSGLADALGDWLDGRRQ